MTFRSFERDPPINHSFPHIFDMEPYLGNDCLLVMWSMKFWASKKRTERQINAMRIFMEMWQQSKEKGTPKSIKN